MQKVLTTTGHVSYLVNATELFEDGHQFVLETIARQLSDENFAATSRRRLVPVGRRSVASLPVLLLQRISGAPQQRLDFIGIDAKQGRTRVSIAAVIHRHV